MSCLHVLMGVPGAGKSSWAWAFYHPSTIADNSFSRRAAGFGWDLPVVVPAYYSTDELRQDLFGDLDQTQNDLLFGVWHWLIHRDLSRGRSVIADSTALDKRAREQLLTIAHENGAEANLIWFKDYKEAVKRNAGRWGKQRVPDEVMERMLNKDRVSEFQVPREPWDTVTLIESFGP